MNTRENQCSGKTKYHTKEQANESVKHLNRLGGRRVSTYKCPICFRFHFGHQTKGKMSRHEKRNKKITDFDHESSIHIGDKRFLK